MKNLSIYYNPYTCVWRMWETENKQKIELGKGNGLRNYNKQFFYACFDRLLKSIINEYNDEVNLYFYSREYECQILDNYILKNKINNIHLKCGPCPIKKSVQERLKDLNAICKKNRELGINKQFYRVNVYLDKKYTQYADVINKILVGNEYCEIKCIAHNISEYYGNNDRTTTNIYITDNVNLDFLNNDNNCFVLLEGHKTKFVDKIHNLLIFEFDVIMNGIKQILFFKTMTDVLAFSKNEFDRMFYTNLDYRAVFLIEPEIIIEPINYIEVGDSAKICTRVNPIGNSTNELYFEVNNSEVLMLYGNKIIGKSPGNAIIRAWELGAFEPVVEFSCRVERVVHISKITIPKQITIAKGSTTNYNIMLYPTNADDLKDLKIYGSNPQVAVFEKGQLKGLRCGTTVLSVEAPRCSAKCEILVQNPLEQIIPSSEEIRIKVKESAKLSYTTFPEQYFEEEIYTSSSKPDVAEYVAGIVQGKKSGVAIITFKSSRGITAKCKIIVSPEDTPLMKMFNKMTNILR